MQRATVDELARDPVGRYVAGDTFVHFCAAPTLWGLLLWGRPDEQHARSLGRSLVLELAPPAVQHASIIDASRLDAADAGAFHAAERYLVHQAEALKKWLWRVALIRPSGIGGAVVAGAFDVLPRPYPVRVFTDAAAAFAWLADPAEGAVAGTADWPVDGAAFLDALHADAASHSPLLGRLRVLLDGRLVGLAVADAARELGVSERTLQRKLGELGTTFGDELGDARIRAAKRRLLETDAQLTEIAFDVGCSSLQQFSALFRKREGESPSAYRQRKRSRP